MRTFAVSVSVFLILAVVAGSGLAADIREKYTTYRSLADTRTADTEPAEAYSYTYSGRINLADDLSQQGHLIEAKRILERLLEEYPDDSDVKLKLAFVELKLGKYSSARSRFKSITETIPDYADAWYGLGLVHRKLDRPKESLEALNRAIEESPDRAYFYVQRGHIHKSLGQFGHAISDYNRAAELDEDVQANRLIRRLGVATARETTPWLARVNHGVTDLRDSGDDWRYYGAELGYDAVFGYVNLDIQRESRGDTWDSSLGVNAYFDLWGKSYGNVRYRRSTDQNFLPDHDIFLEYFHPIGDGWIGSVNYRFRGFALVDANSYGARIAYYRGNWFYRLLGEVIEFSDRDERGFQRKFLVRNYFWENDDDYIQAYVSAGNDIEPLVTGPSRRSLDSNSVGLFVRKFLTDSIGADLLLDHTDPEQLSIRQTAEIGVFYRW